jgi:outer membrane protein TolC
MPTNRTLALLAVATLGLSWPLLGQTVTQEEFLSQLKRTHPVFEKEEMTARIIQENRRSLLGMQDWNVGSTLFYTHEEPSLAFAGPERTDALSASGGVERLFWNTGGRLSASFSSGYASMKISPAFGISDSYFENRFEVGYSHPLMRNSHGALDRLEYDLKQYDIDMSEVTARENQEDFLAAAGQRFLDWVFLTEQKKIFAERVNLSEEELVNTQEKRSANLIDEVDVIRAEDAVRIARQNLLLAESQWKALQAELAVLAQDESYSDASPEYDIYGVVVLPALNETIAQLADDSRLLRILSIRLDQLAETRSGFRELEKPDLAFVTRLGIKNAKEDFGSSMVMDKPDAAIGLQLGFPAGNRTAKARVAQVDLQMIQLERQLEELKLNLSSGIANVHTQIVELERVLVLNQDQIESARKKTEEELKLYNQGRGDLTFVIQSRDSEQAAKLTYASNALTYHKLLLKYRALVDQLHE